MRFSRTITTIVFFGYKRKNVRFTYLTCDENLYIFIPIDVFKYSADIRTILLHMTRYIKKRTRMYRSQPHPNHSLRS